ncbi:uncharacterized protein LOC143605271 [Bidens hawaiensis]|uniref:uncharacterized protein LOC143605271 n=1 Tax=Bidens hawaiensis TaxID=980011 RepID=UPI00404B7F9E
MKVLSDYDCKIIYHEGKANVVADTLSQNEHEKPKRVCALRLELHIDLIDQLKNALKQELEESKVTDEKRNGTIDQLIKGNYGDLIMGRRIWVPIVGNLRGRILEEAYKSKYMMHLGSNKMYQNLRSDYWCIDMKKDIGIYVAKFLTCSKVKAEHQAGLLHQPKIPIWKWDMVNMDFIMKLTKTSRQNDAIWVDNIVSMHSVLLSIISNRDSRFTSQFGKFF